MPNIYVELRVVYPSKAPAAYKAKAVAQMEKTAKDILANAPGMTTAGKDGDGAAYAVRIIAQDVKIEAMLVTVTIKGELMRHPDEMLSTTHPTSTAKVPGKPSDDAVMQCIEAATESVMNKVIPAIRRDAAR